MAKGRRLTASRSERYLGSYSNGHSQWMAEDDGGELEEEDIWATADDYMPKHDINCADAQADGPRFAQNGRHMGGLSLAFDESSSSSRIVHQIRGNMAEIEGSSKRVERSVAASAPVNVPDWSKIYRVTSVESINDSDEEGESDMVPPHEYVARSQARKAGASVFEGVGRTLKGRDMRRIRDAVWSQTGFYG